MTKTRRSTLLGTTLIILGVYIGLLCSSVNEKRAILRSGRDQPKVGSWQNYRNLNEENKTKGQQVTPPYDQDSIELFWDHMQNVMPLLFVFDGNTFKAYALGHQKLGFRYVKVIPLLVHALKSSYPDRFQPGQPVFQMIFTISDGLSTKCVNDNVTCPDEYNLFAPVAAFSTSYRDETILPTVKWFPHPEFGGCIYDWKLDNKAGCPSWPNVHNKIRWDDLKNTIIWRGSDFRFFLDSFTRFQGVNEWWVERACTRDALAGMTKPDIINKLMANYHDLSPRWQAVALTLRTKEDDKRQNHWIDAMFTGESGRELHDRFAERGLPVSEKHSMSPEQMSQYKYQIDLAGGMF